MNIKKLAAIRRVAADEINATSIQPETVVKLCDEIIAATQRAEAAEARVRELEQHLFEISNGVTLTTTNDMLRYPRATE